MLLVPPQSAKYVDRCQQSQLHLASEFDENAQQLHYIYSVPPEASHVQSPHTGLTNGNAESQTSFRTVAVILS